MFLPHYKPIAWHFVLNRLHCHAHHPVNRLNFLPQLLASLLSTKMHQIDTCHHNNPAYDVPGCKPLFKDKVSQKCRYNGLSQQCWRHRRCRQIALGITDQEPGSRLDANAQCHKEEPGTVVETCKPKIHKCRIST